MTEKRKIEILQLVLANKIKLSEAGFLLKRSERTVYRLCAQLSQKGLCGVLHGNKGKRSPRQTPARLQTRILRLASEKYADVNDTHLTELLKAREKISIGRSTLRRILRLAGLAAKRKRRRSKYRARRERKPAMGTMLQIDASPHDWLEGRGPWLTLVGAKDDATGYVWAHFTEAETTWSYLELMEQVFLSHGLPMSLYSDRHSIFHSTREQTIVEQLKNTRPLTQFGRAMEALGVHVLKAWSPQAKGRIERQWGVFQDRLVVELRLQGAKTMQQANQVLRSFLADYNQRFVIPAREATPVFRKAPRAEQLKWILSIRHQRIVNRDHTISFEGLILQIPPSKHFYSLAKKTVDVLQLKDGRIQILYRTRVVAEFAAASVTRMVIQQEPSKTELKLVVSN